MPRKNELLVTKEQLANAKKALELLAKTPKESVVMTAVNIAQSGASTKPLEETPAAIPSPARILKPHARVEMRLDVPPTFHRSKPLLRKHSFTPMTEQMEYSPGAKIFAEMAEFSTSKRIDYKRLTKTMGELLNALDVKMQTNEFLSDDGIVVAMGGLKTQIQPISGYDFNKSIEYILSGLEQRFPNEGFAALVNEFKTIAKVHELDSTQTIEILVSKKRSLDILYRAFLIYKQNKLKAAKN
jgi:hypothetical protein